MPKRGDIDNAIVSIKFVNGAIGVIDNTRVAGYGAVLSGEIIGSKCAVSFGPKLTVGPVVKRPGEVAHRHAGRLREYCAEAYIGELEAFCRNVVRDGQEPESSALEAAAAFELAAAANISLREGRTVRVARTGAGATAIYRVV